MPDAVFPPAEPSAGLAQRRADFSRLVRQALSHLYDLAYLQHHPLTAWLTPQPGTRPAATALALQQRLLAAIDTLRPDDRLPSGARSSRGYRLLRLRYVEGLEIDDVCGQLGISAREYWREHRRSLDAATASLIAVLDASQPAVANLPGRPANSQSQVTSEMQERGSMAIAEREHHDQSIRAPEPDAPASTSSTIRLPVRTPLVGRAVELSFLREEYHAAAAGEGGRLVLISGDPGAGKTRLAEELGRWAVQHGGAFLRGGHLRQGGVPYAPWIEALRGGLRDLSPDQTVRAIGPYGPDLVLLLPEIAALLGPQPELPPLEPEQRRQRLHDGIAGLLINLSRTRPLVLLLDDLQWASTLALLAQVARRLPEARAVIVGAYRRQELEEQQALARECADLERIPAMAAMALGLLSRDETAIMLAHHVGDRAAAVVAAPVYRRTRGNPFFVEETLRALVESGAVRRTAAGWEAGDLAGLRQPASLARVIRDRVARLGPDAERALAGAAVLGMEFPYALLAAVSGLDDGTLAACLERAIQAGLVLDLTRPGEERFAFADDQVQEALYEGLAGTRRRRLHLRAGEALEALSEERGQGEGQVGELARHFREGNDLERGAGYAFRAGQRAEGVYAWPQALGWYRMALEQWEVLGGHLGERAMACERMGDLCWRTAVDAPKGWGYFGQALALYEQVGDRQKQGELHMLLGREYLYGGSAEQVNIQKSVEHLQQAETLLREGGPSAVLGSVYVNLAHAHGFLGQPNEAMRWGTQALEVSEKVGDLALTTYANTALSAICTVTGDLAQSREALERAWQVGGRDGMAFESDYVRQSGALVSVLVKAPREALVWEARYPDFHTLASVVSLRICLTEAYALLGKLDEGARAFGELRQTLEGMGQIASRFHPSITGRLFLYRGEWDEARSLLVEGVAWAIGVSHFWMAAAARQRLGEVYLALAQDAEAEEQLCQALHYFRDSSHLVYVVDLLPHLCALEVRTGRVEQAERHLEEAQAILARPQEWCGLPAGVFQAEGLVWAAQGRWTEAEAAFARAVAVCQEHELRWDEAKVYYEWACALLGNEERRSEDQERVRELLGKAGEMWERMGAGPWAERCRARLAELVPLT